MFLDLVWSEHVVENLSSRLWKRAVKLISAIATNQKYHGVWIRYELSELNIQIYQNESLNCEICFFIYELTKINIEKW